MLLSDVSVKRPVFATVINLLLIIFGIVAFTMLSLREYPDIDPPPTQGHRLILLRLGSPSYWKIEYRV